MQDIELFHQFVEFCEGQPKDKVIDHSNWQSCAVGEFAASKGIEIVSDGVTNWEFLETLLGERETDNVRDIIATADSGGDLSTYGECTTKLKEFL